MIGSFRTVVKDMAVYGIGDVILRGAAFVTIPIYTRLLSPADYGRWGFVLAAVAVVSGVIGLGSDTAYARYFFEAADEEARRVVTSTWFSFLAVWSVAVALLALPFSGVFSDWSFGTNSYGTLFALALATLPLSLMNTMLGQALRNEFRAKVYSVLNVTSTLLIVTLGVAGALIATRPLVGIFAGGLIATAATLPVRIWLVRHLFTRSFSPALLRRLLAFGLPLVPAGLAWWVFSASDRIVLGKLSTLSEVGLYTIAIGITSVLGLFVTALGMAWSPHSLHVYEQRRDEAPAFFGRMATYIILGFSVLCVLVTTFAHEVLVLLSTPDFYGADVAVGPLALGFVAFASTQITASGISLRKKTSWFFHISLTAAILNLGLNLALVPRWGMQASAWATFSSYVFLTLAYFVVAQRLWAVVYEARRVLTLCVLTVGFTVGVRLLPDLSTAASALLKCGYVASFLALLWAFRVLEQRELEVLRALVRGRLSPRPGPL
jgi:O-antigen/teichoic acid export membrane protein